MRSGHPVELGGLRVLRPLGEGGMGAVYLVQDPRTGGLRALKALRPDASDEARRRFKLEAEVMARVDDHPNVVRIHGAGEHQGAPYIVMAFTPGGDLASRLHQGPLPPDAVVRLGVALARGLAHVHACGVLHRDLKPANVLFDERGTPMLVDFGLAKLARGDRLTQTGTLLGTPAYMAPEQANAQGDVDARADVYGLGAVLYHALTGRPPFEGGSLWRLLERVLREAPTPPRRLAPGTPPALERVILRALAKAPGDRFPSAAALADALEGLDAPAARRPWPRLALALAALTVVVVLVTLARGSSSSTRPDTAPLAPTAVEPPPSPVHDAELALAALAAERPEVALAAAAARAPRGRDDPLAPIVAAAARLTEDSVPPAWGDAVARMVGSLPVLRQTIVMDRLTAELEERLQLLDTGRGVSRRELEAVKATVAALTEASARAADGAPRIMTTAASIRAQRLLMAWNVRILEATAWFGGLSAGERAARQGLARAVLFDAAALAPGSLSALALRVTGSLMAVESPAHQAAAWELLDEGGAATARRRELEDRYPWVVDLHLAVWFCVAGLDRLSVRHEEVQARWQTLTARLAWLFDAEGQLLPAGERPLRDELLALLVRDGATIRAEVALRRAWDAREGPSADAAGEVAVAAARVFSRVYPHRAALHLGRLHLLHGDAAGATQELEALAGLQDESAPALRLQAVRLLADRDLLAGDPGRALRRLEELAALDPNGTAEDAGYWCGQALARALMGQAAATREALARARQLADAPNSPRCPWATPEVTARSLAAIERGWTPARAGRLYALPGE